MKIRKCKVCGKEFESHRGTLFCSQECRDEHTKEQWREANKRRYHGLSGMPVPKTCPICGKVFEGLMVVYCSDNCRKIARKQQVKENYQDFYKENREYCIEIAKKKNKERKLNTGSC